jgi:hypothetical protein
MRHQYERMTIQDVMVGVRGDEGDIIIVEDPLSEARHAVGCKNCDKSLADALVEPNCSGAPDEIPSWVEGS